jgi:hypothetical protein
MYTFLMRDHIKAFFLKEYGAWSVLIVSALTGLGVSREFSWKVIPVFLALGLLVNSKQAYTTWVSQAENKQVFGIFLAQVVVAAGIFVAVYGSDIIILLPLLVFPAAYFLAKWLLGEHFIVTELLGFVVLSLAAVIVKSVIFGGLDVRLFVAVAFYFMAGVFKVKALLSNKTRDRIVSLLYIGVAVFAYRGMHIPIIILLPIVDNFISAIAPYKVKLQTTGWIEVAKSLVFLGMMVAFY